MGTAITTPQFSQGFSLFFTGIFFPVDRLGKLTF